MSEKLASWLDTNYLSKYVYYINNICQNYSYNMKDILNDIAGSVYNFIIIKFGAVLSINSDPISTTPRKLGNKYI